MSPLIIARRIFSLYLLPLALLSLAMLSTNGCQINQTAASSPVATITNPAIEGRAYGGEQPLVGATVQLYAAGTPASGGGYGQGATALITGTLPTTDVNGDFIITGDYTAPTAPSHFYIVVTGGSPGSSNPVNPDVTLISAIGGCTATIGLPSSLFVNVNEVTTIATITALQQFMAAPAAGNLGAPDIGAPSTAYNSLQNAFETVTNLASISTAAVTDPLQDYAASASNGSLVDTMADILVVLRELGPLQHQQLLHTAC